jgi:hypothetical protein
MKATTLLRRSLIALVGIAMSVGAQAQQHTMPVVTLVSADKGSIGSTRIPKKDIAPELARKFAAQENLRMVELRACPGVSPEAVTEITNELQKNKLIVVVDLHEPDRQLCAN